MKTSLSLFSKKSSSSTSPRDVFLHLLMMVMLYIVVISFTSLSFDYVNFSFPDALNYYLSGTLDSIRIQSSMLVVSFPLLLIFAYLIQRDIKKNPAKHELKFSKWLIYLTLFLSAITIVVDLIQLVNRFYSGDLTTSFLLKVLSVLVVAGGVFGYYLWDVQHEPDDSKIPLIFGFITSILALGMLALGFYMVGSPAHQRQIRMDERRLNDLQAIQGEVINYWQLKRVLPASLDDLKNDINGFHAPLDPETNSAYEYSILKPLKFNLCAIFNQENLLNTDALKSAMPLYYDYGNSNNWQHPAGKSCFERTIDPDLFPKR